MVVVNHQGKPLFRAQRTQLDVERLSPLPRRDFEPRPLLSWHLSKMVIRSDDTMIKTHAQYKRYYDRSVQTTVSIRCVQMVYVYRAPDLTL